MMLEHRKLPSVGRDRSSSAGAIQIKTDAQARTNLDLGRRWVGINNAMALFLHRPQQRLRDERKIDGRNFTRELHHGRVDLQCDSHWWLSDKAGLNPVNTRAAALVSVAIASTQPISLASFGGLTSQQLSTLGLLQQVAFFAV